MTARQAKSLRRELERTNGLLKKEVGCLTANDVALICKIYSLFVTEDDCGVSIPFKTLNEVPSLLTQYQH